MANHDSLNRSEDSEEGQGGSGPIPTPENDAPPRSSIAFLIYWFVIPLVLVLLAQVFHPLEWISRRLGRG